MLTRKLMTTVAGCALAFGALAGCTAKSGSTPSGSGTRAAQNSLALLVSDVTGSLQKVANSPEKVTSLSFTMSGTSGGVAVSGEGAMAFQPLKGELTVQSGAAGTTTVRILDNAFYVKVPASQQAELRGKSWLKMTGGKDSPFGSASRQMQDVNPIQQVKTLLASGKAVAVGQETVDGVPTVHYKATTSVATALEQVDPKYRSMVKGVYDRAGVKEVTTEIWIDAQYRPHRAHVVAGTLSDMTVEYRDYNKPVTVAAPPANDTLDLDQVLKGLGA